MPVRLFVAINPPDGVREHIAACTADLRSLTGFRWVAPETIHLTLKFLGETDEGMARRVADALARVGSGRAPFTARLEAPGAFPSLRRPRVLWIGLDGGRELAVLYGELEDALTELGIERESREFHPHLTLGRARRGRSVDERRLDSLLGRTKLSGSWRVERLDLMRSRLRPTGAVYDVLASAALLGPSEPAEAHDRDPGPGGAGDEGESVTD